MLMMWCTGKSVKTSFVSICILTILGLFSYTVLVEKLSLLQGIARHPYPSVYIDIDLSRYQNDIKEEDAKKTRVDTTEIEATHLAQGEKEATHLAQSENNATYPPKSERKVTYLPKSEKATSALPHNSTLLTLFTTMKDSVLKDPIYRNTIQMWAMLAPTVIPILYVDNDNMTIVRFARKHGWRVYMTPKPNTSEKPKHNTSLKKTSSSLPPVLRTMYLHAQNHTHTPWYCYANADIIFDKSLLSTLAFLTRHLAKLRKVLVVGRRTNVNMGPGENVTSLNQVMYLARGGKLGQSNAEDYFLTTRDGYPWNTIPNFVVGRVGYDNWIVTTALSKRIPVVDATGTILAVHQTDSKGNKEGHNVPKDTKDINKKYAGKGFKFDMGHTTCGQFQLAYTNSTGQSIADITKVESYNLPIQITDRFDSKSKCTGKRLNYKSINNYFLQLKKTTRAPLNKTIIHTL